MGPRSDGRGQSAEMTTLAASHGRGRERAEASMGPRSDGRGQAIRLDRTHGARHNLRFNGAAI